MFSDIMMQDGDPEWNDFPFYPGTVFPSPSMVNFGRLLAKGRDSFVNSTDIKKNEKVDNFLAALEARATGKSKEQIREFLTTEEKEELKRQNSLGWDCDSDGNIIGFLKEVK